jgi:nicotinamidase-related amidase
MTWPRFLLAAAILTLASSVAGTGTQRRKGGKNTVPLQLHLRTRTETPSGHWQEATLLKELPAGETAILICDMWNEHWCRSATRRCDAIAHKMAPIIEAARARGVQIIHSPSDCMEYYKDTPQRRRMMELPAVEPPIPREITEPPLPIDDSDGGCDDTPQDEQRKAWTHQHPAIRIAPEDGISDNGREVYNLLHQRGIKNLIIMGVHTNMCVLGRSFSIRQMTRWGIQCILARDLTDTMYNPRMRPFVSHEKGTELVVEHIEKYWCPSTTSEAILAACGAR